MYESARKYHFHLIAILALTTLIKRVRDAKRYVPVGSGVHAISRLPMPALSNCTFSGSPGLAVSKHHKSLQQTCEKQHVRV